jgi:tight adherence protein C
MSDTGVTAAAVFVAATSLALLVAAVAGGRKGRLDRRLDDLADGDRTGPPRDSVAELARVALPKVGAVLVPGRKEERTRLQTRLIRAGFYGPQAMGVFLGVKLLLVAGPALAGGVVGALGLVPLQTGLWPGAWPGRSG